MFVVAKKLSSSFVALTAVAALVAGCTAETKDSIIEQPAGEPGDPTEGMSAQGLTVSESSQDHVAGRLERSGTAIRFDFSRNGVTHHALVTRDAGEPIFESTLVDGYDTTILLGGKATAKGRPNGEVERTGDENIFTEIAISPEGQLVPQLKEALIAAKVDQDLFRYRPEASSSVGQVGPQDLLTWSLLRGGQAVGFFSWSWWGTTTVVLESFANYWTGNYRATFKAGPAAPEYIDGRGHGSYGRMWWGAYVTVANRWVGLCDIYGNNCQETRMWVRAY